MMITHKLAGKLVAGVLLAGVALVSVGCTRLTTQLALTSYTADGAARQTFHFDHCSYRYDAQGDLWLVARRAPANADKAADVPAALLELHVYWDAHPGVTVAEETTDNATIRYLLSSNTGTALYEGTGFVYVRERGGQRVAKLEGGRLLLRERTGTLEGIPGDSRVAGSFVASQDVDATVDVSREIDSHQAVR